VTPGVDEHELRVVQADSNDDRLGAFACRRDEVLWVARPARIRPSFRHIFKWPGSGHVMHLQG
jgi:hypothetical protein